MDHAICEFAASDGYRMRYRHYPPVNGAGPRGYVVALHGIQSHSGWYGHSSSRLRAAGYDVRFLDRRGSGLNPHERGHAAAAERLINDVAQFLAEVRHERNRMAPLAPVVLLGISWGGKLAVVTAARRPELIDGLALLYPGICPHVRPRWHHAAVIGACQALGQAHRLVEIPLNDPELFTAEPQWREFIRGDELALHRATVSFLKSSLDLDRLAAEAGRRIRCPVLLMLAGRDRIIDNAATRRYFASIPAADKQLLEYPDAEHTLEFEPNRDRIIGDLVEWLAAACGEC